MRFGRIGKTMTSNEETVFWKPLVVVCELLKKNLLVRDLELDYGLENHCRREKTPQTTGKHDYEAEDLRKTTTIDDTLKRPVVKLTTLFSESVFR